MLRNARFPVTRLYAVEVSSWDCKEVFFVENCELDWNEESGKQITLKRALNDHAILLVRLLQQDHSDRSLPVVYDAELVGKTKSGLQQFRLKMAVPRLKEEPNFAACPETLPQALELP